ncbi:MAG: TOBE domain-containing protein [Amaricoccus sp.]|uniref:TOBE domain-containing protein n=1 Tax=Amaricoccus sp. TaxID=1872485 RepID=UPI0039E5ED4A
MPLHAEISLHAPNGSPLGEPRIALLEAIGREGSISGAARALGLSYRGAWDAICAMNNLVGRPLVAGQTGGRSGGGARLTEDGVRLIAGFRRLQVEMARAFNAVAPELAAGPAGEAMRAMLVGFRRTSARNALWGRVVSTVEGAVNAEVGLEIAEGVILRATLTSRSLRELGLFPGQPAVALVKAPMIAILPTPAAASVAGNRIAGVVAYVAQDATSTEISLDVGGGKTLCAILASGADTAPGFGVGDPAVAAIDPAHVILAVE